MMIGALGDVPFLTGSAELGAVLDDIEWKSSQRYAKHATHGQTDVIEYVGAEADEISFDVKLSAFLGVNPLKMINRLTNVMRGREAIKLSIGTFPIPGKWVITDISRGLEYFHKDGTLLSADVTVKLREYVEIITMPLITNRLKFTDRMASAVTVGTSGNRPSVAGTDRAVRVSGKSTTGKTASEKRIKAGAKKIVEFVKNPVPTLQKAANKLTDVVKNIKNAFDTANKKANTKAPKMIKTGGGGSSGMPSKNKQTMLLK